MIFKTPELSYSFDAWWNVVDWAKVAEFYNDSK